MDGDKWSLLRKLKRAVNKIKFLLKLDAYKWKLASILGASSSKKRLSFNNKPGLISFVEDSDSNDDPGSVRSASIQRTISFPPSSSPSSQPEDDVDKRAEAFIANFYKQLQIERQISLELRYNRATSFESVASP